MTGPEKDLLTSGLIRLVGETLLQLSEKQGCYSAGMQICLLIALLSDH